MHTKEKSLEDSRLYFVSGEGTAELIKILAIVIGSFFGSLFLIIIFTVLYQKCRNRQVDSETRR